jgi:hypothetical protein
MRPSELTRKDFCCAVVTQRSHPRLMEIRRTDYDTGDSAALGARR